MKFFRKLIAAAAALSVFTAAAPAYSYAELSAYLAPAQSASVSVTAANGENSFASISEAGIFFRSQLKSRNTSISIILPKSSDSLSAIVNELMSEALAETGDPTEGDYLRLTISSYRCQSMVSSTRIQLNFTMNYHTSAAQEKAVDDKIAEIIGSLGIRGKSDYDKIKAIYSYIASNVVYADGVDDSDIYSSYGALMNGEAVCQGFSQLLYRMLGEVGIRSRVVAGTSSGVNHAWNLADVDGQCYLMDVTWDSSFHGKNYFYFLKGSSDFDSFTAEQTHVTGSGKSDNSALYLDYTSAEFTSAYPVSKTAYDPTAYVLGDVDGDGKITSADASAVLAAYAKASAIGETGLTSLECKAADVNSDGRVDAIDSAYILKYYSLASAGQTVDFSEFPLNK